MPAPAIGRRRRWAPGPTATIDRSHPLAAGLVFCDWYPDGQPIERQATKTGVRTATPLGAGCGNSGDTGAATYPSSALYFPPATGLTHVVVGRWTMASGTYLAQCVAATANDGEITWYNVGGGGINLYVDAGAPAANLGSASGAYDRDLVLGCSIGAAGGFTSYVDGLVAGSASTAAPDIAVPTALGVGCKADGTTGVPCTVNLYAIWHRALSASEHAMLASDPFCMLRI